MAKAYQFNVGKKTTDAYQKELRNTKAKLNRVRKKYGVDLSEEIALPKLEDFSSRKEFNQWVRDVKAFRGRGNLDYQFQQNQYGVVATKREIFNIKQDTKKAQALADRRLKEAHVLPFVSGGKEQGTVGMQRPNKTGVSRPKDFDFDSVRNQKRLKEITMGMRNKASDRFYEKSDQQLLDNFITVLEGSFHNEADALIALLRDMNPRDFYDVFLMFDEFDFALYDSDGNGNNVEADSGTISQMMAYMREYKRGNIDLTLTHENFNKNN